MTKLADQLMAFYNYTDTFNAVQFITVARIR